MKLKVMGTATDLRTQTPVVYAQLPISDFLNLVGNDFKNFAIQRRREKHKAYDRLKSDLVEGALLPSITLAVHPDRVNSLLPLVKSQNLEELSKELAIPGRVNILDGLQRTYIIEDLVQAGEEFDPAQTVHLEFWLEADTRHLVYRIIVLNAGQKPMSMRHQIELLFITLRERIQNQIPDLELATERDQTRRRRSRKYALDRVASAYQCFLTKNPEVRKENIVAQRLVEEEALDSTEEQLNRQFSNFVETLSIYAKLDDQVCRLYPTVDSEEKLPTGANWFGSENVMQSFFAAVAQFGSTPERSGRVKEALTRLVSNLEQEDSGDPLGMRTLQDLTNGFNTRKVNIGTATRKLLFNGFKEYFREAGESSLSECWVLGSE